MAQGRGGSVRTWQTWHQRLNLSGAERGPGTGESVATATGIRGALSPATPLARAAAVKVTGGKRHRRRCLEAGSVFQVLKTFRPRCPRMSPDVTAAGYRRQQHAE